MNISLFDRSELDNAKAMIWREYKGHCSKIAELAQIRDFSSYLEKFARLVEAHPGVMAIEKGELVGFLAGIPITSFKGTQKGVWCPYWGNVAIGRNRRKIYRLMYEKIGKLWVQNGCFTHAISLASYDTEALDTWFWNGFGLLVIDATRNLEPIDVKVTEKLEIRTADKDDLDAVLSLEYELGRYMTRSPILMPLLAAGTYDDYEKWLSDPSDRMWWIAVHNGEVVSYIRTQEAQPDDEYEVPHKNTLRVNGAYTVPEMRGKNIATLLLKEIAEWARDNDYERLSVDFESQNIYGSSFWLRHFRPVQFTLIRKIDERVAWASENRDRKLML